MRILIAVLLLWSAAAMAQPNPGEPIRWNVPAGPGSAMDVLARLVAPKMSESLRQPLIVENRPEANSMLVARAEASAAPDQGLIAGDARSSQPVQVPFAGVTRKILSQSDGPAPGYTTIMADITIEAGVVVPRHIHPGIEAAYVLEGAFEHDIEGHPMRILKPGDAVVIPAETPHGLGRATSAKSRVLIIYIVEKDKPLIKRL